MTFLSALALAGAMFFLAASPGPGVFAVVARSLASGFSHGVVLALGCILGDLLFLLMAIYGLTAIAEMLGGLFTLIKYIGGGYLIYLGIKIIRSKSEKINVKGIAESSWKANFLSGLFITLGNPKVILFYLSFLPTFMDLSTLQSIDVFVAATIVSIVLGAVLTLYAWMADRAKHTFQSTEALHRMNIGAGSAMIGAGSFLLLKP